MTASNVSQTAHHDQPTAEPVRLRRAGLAANVTGVGALACPSCGGPSRLIFSRIPRVPSIVIDGESPGCVASRACRRWMSAAQRSASCSYDMEARSSGSAGVWVGSDGAPGVHLAAARCRPPSPSRRAPMLSQPWWYQPRELRRRTSGTALAGVGLRPYPAGPSAKRSTRRRALGRAGRRWWRSRRWGSAADDGDA
jgi:hypothetical protein